MSQYTRRRRSGLLSIGSAGYRKPLDQEVGYHPDVHQTTGNHFNNFIMKTRLCLFVNTVLLFGLLAAEPVSAQTSLIAEVGAIRNGDAVVTNSSLAAIVLKGGLSATATISNIHIEFEPESGKYYLIGSVSNDRVTGKAIALQPGKGGVLLAASGPGVEITCTGFNCGRCVPKITKMNVRCVCEDANPPSDMRCDMLSKVVVSLW